ncbi:MAG: SGNH/GDSL hydrolase family protein [Deltaproteobacteria bacterium]|nr:SGNH/GDSL hydrolase family protein [Deltaproteobacteria bacterium]
MRQGGRATRARRHRTAVKYRVIGSLLLLLVVLLVGEGAARVVGPEVPAWNGGDTGSVVMVGHPTRLWGMGVGVRENSGATATINELGLRGEVPVTPRPAQQERILVLGDSTYFGHGVADADTFPSQLEGLLVKKGLKVDVVNGGIPGYSTEQSRLLLDEVGWALEPTLLIVGSLWSDNNFDHFEDADLLRTTQVMSGYRLLSKSAFFQVLAGTVDRLRGGRGAHIVTWTKSSAWPTVGVRRVPLQRYAENLDLMVRDARERGVGVLFFTPCNREMARGDSEDDVAWGAYFDAQARVAAHHGLPIAATRHAMFEAAKRTGVEALLVDTMHPSAAGHAIFASVAANALDAAGWPGARLIGRGPAFPFDKLEDFVPMSEDALNPRSPQVNLFKTGGPPPSTSVHSGGGEDMRWWPLAGEVTGGSGPVRVEVRSPTGDQISVANLPEPGPFSVNVRVAFREVRVVAVGANGAQVEARATKGGGDVLLALP